MRQIWIIAKRELKSYFDSLLAYIMIVAFLAFTGFFTWLSANNIFFMKMASLHVFFSISFWTLFFFIPALTMRLIAEETNTGTIEILLTKAVNDWQMVVGKFLATFLLIAIALGLTLPYYISVASLGPVDHGSVWAGYFGLLLTSAAYIGIGLFASSISTNQIVAFIIALLIGIFFQLLFGLIAGGMTGILGNIFDFMSLRTHYDSITRGIIDSKDVIYFISIAFLGLFGSEAILAKRNITDK